MRAAALLVVLMIASGVAAGETPERRVLAPEEAAGEYVAVGRLERGGRGFCTATLVGPDHVLSAAHCLHDPRTGAPVPIGDVRFTIGGRKPEERTARRVAAVAVPAGYRLSDRSAAAVARDVALLALDRPFGGVPTERASEVWASWEPVEIVGYFRDRDAIPVATGPCAAEGPVGQLAILGCASARGGSGGPVLTGTGTQRRLVGVVSAIGTAADGGPVTIAVPVGPFLAELGSALGFGPAE
jgi:secreted trypsin-like serine protease